MSCSLSHCNCHNVEAPEMMPMVPVVLSTFLLQEILQRAYNSYMAEFEKVWLATEATKSRETSQKMQACWTMLAELNVITAKHVVLTEEG